MMPYKKNYLKKFLLPHFGKVTIHTSSLRGLKLRSSSACFPYSGLKTNPPGCPRTNPSVYPGKWDLNVSVNVFGITSNLMFCNDKESETLLFFSGNIFTLELPSASASFEQLIHVYSQCHDFLWVRRVVSYQDIESIDRASNKLERSSVYVLISQFARGFIGPII